MDLVYTSYEVQNINNIKGETLKVNQEIAGTSNPGKIGTCLEYFPLIENSTYSWIIAFKLIVISDTSLPRLMGTWSLV